VHDERHADAADFGARAASRNDHRYQRPSLEASANPDTGRFGVELDRRVNVAAGQVAAHSSGVGDGKQVRLGCDVENLRNPQRPCGVLEQTKVAIVRPSDEKCFDTACSLDNPTLRDHEATHIVV
jgi:hypothetical protein